MVVDGAENVPEANEKEKDSKEGEGNTNDGIDPKRWRLLSWILVFFTHITRSDRASRVLACAEREDG